MNMDIDIYIYYTDTHIYIYTRCMLLQKKHVPHLSRHLRHNSCLREQGVKSEKRE